MYTKDELKLTNPEKILLHLSEYKFPRNNAIAPYAVSQAGIAELTGFETHHVSRTLKSLMKKDLVSESISYIEGKVRKVKIYFLTQDGEIIGNNLRLRLEKVKIDVTSNNKIEQLLLCDVQKRLEPHKSLLRTILDLNRKHKLYLEGNRLILSGGDDHHKIVWNLPSIKYFFGRKNEFKQLKNWLNSPGVPNTVLIYGIAGIGKTSLAIKVANEYKDIKNIFWHQVHEWDTISSMVHSLNEFVSMLKRGTLKRYLKYSQSLDYSLISVILEESLTDLDALLVFDDIHKKSDETDKLLSILMTVVEKLGNGRIKILTVSRHIPSFYSRRDVTVKKSIAEMELMGLDKKSSIALLNETKMMKADMAERIYRFTRGHPLFLEMVEVNGGTRYRSMNIQRFIQEEITPKLNKAEKDVLCFVSVFREPAPKEVLLSSNIVSYNDISQTIIKGFLKETETGFYEIHDVLKDFFYDTMVRLERRKYHKMAAEYYEGLDDNKHALEAVYHYLQAEDGVKAARMLANNGSSILNSGYTNDLSAMLDVFDYRRLPMHLQAEMLLLKGDISYAQSSFDNAKSLYEKAFDILKKIKKKSYQGEPLHIKISSSYRKIGNALETMGKYDEAMTMYDNALVCYKNASKVLETGKILRDKGTLFFKMGRLDSAIKFCNEALGIFKKLSVTGEETASALNALGEFHRYSSNVQLSLTYFNKNLSFFKKTGNLFGLSKTYNNIAAIYWETGHMKDAISFFEKSLNLKKRLGDIRGIVTVHLNMGVISMEKGEYDKALHFFENSLELSEKISDQMCAGSSIQGISNVYYEKGEYKKAAEYIERSLKIFKKLNNQMLINFALCDLSQLQIKENKLTDALDNAKNALKLARNLNSINTKGYSLRIIGLIKAKQNDWRNAKVDFENAILMFKETGIKREIARTYFEYGKLLKEKGDSEKAKKNFKMAMKFYNEMNMLWKNNEIRKETKGL